MSGPAVPSRAAHLARLMLTYGSHWRITVSVPGTGPRVLTAIETGTGRCVQARSESELEARLTAEPAQRAGPAPGAHESADLPGRGFAGMVE